MNARFEIVNAVVEEALDLLHAEREAFVTSRCGSDDGLAAEVQRLLAMSNSMDGFLDLAPAATPEPGPGYELSGRFRIVEELGSGATGSVFLAEDRHLGEVAIKVLHPEMRGDARAMARFLAEIRIARDVRHPNICPVYDFFMFDSSSCGPAGFTMKYLRGETLAVRLLRGAIPPAEAIRIARGIGAGLDVLHDSGVVHRDLKPANIMLTYGSDGCVVPVIMDFGLASRLADGEAAGSGAGAAISGSPDYMAPEQFRGAAAAKSADIYAFGLILFETIAGSRPFPPEELLPAVIRRTTEEAPRLCAVAPWTPPAWDSALARALSRSAAQRPASATALLYEMAGGSVRTQGQCRHQPPRIRIRRSKSGQRQRQAARLAEALG